MKKRRQIVKGFSDTNDIHGDDHVCPTRLTDMNNIEDCRENYYAYFTHENKIMPSLHTISEPSEESVSSGESEHEMQVSSFENRVSTMAKREGAYILQSLKQPQWSDIMEFREKEWPRTHTTHPVVINAIEDETESLSWIAMYLHEFTAFGAPISDPEAEPEIDVKEVSDEESHINQP